MLRCVPWLVSSSAIDAEDSAGYTGRLYDLLSAHFGATKLFIDLDSNPPRVRIFRKSSNVISRRPRYFWQSLEPGGSHPRTMPARVACRIRRTLVRREIAAALDRRIKIVPVLVGGASMLWFPGFAGRPCKARPIPGAPDQRYGISPGRVAAHRCPAGVCEARGSGTEKTEETAAADRQGCSYRGRCEGDVGSSRLFLQGLECEAGKGIAHGVRDHGAPTEE